ncbi:MAG: aspartate carbamoyltransferase [Acidobacteria bacterium]|nr:aspartate carbamoyltransferase [Acidobacteriota bacterium]
MDALNTTNHPRHLVKVDSLTLEEILRILDGADEFRDPTNGPSLLAGKLVCLMFFQPSTRTRLGFDVAVKRLGGDTTSLDGPKYEQGMGWSEPLEDLLRVVSDYCDVVVVRHPSTIALEHALPYSSAPVINAGSGREHHPTQALIDLYCIRSRMGHLTDLRIGMVGDLAGSRTARSFVQVLAHWAPAELRLMAPPGRSLDDSVTSAFGAGVVVRHPCLVPDDLDVLYVAELPNAPDSPPYDISLRAALGVTPARVTALPEHAIVLCPGPRLDEIDREVDGSHRAAYFAQSRDGLRVRMAVLAHLVKHCTNKAVQYSGRWGTMND